MSSTFHLSRRPRIASIAAGLVLLTGAAAPAALLFYGGDYHGGLYSSVNGQNTGYSDTYAFDNFTISDPGGWVVTSFFSNNLMNFDIGVPGPGRAYYEVRQGMSPGDGGSLISSGTVPATQTPTGRMNGSDVEYTILGTLPSSLTLGPGNYFLSIVPIGFGSGDVTPFSFITATDGANGVGSPLGNYNTFWWRDGGPFYDPLLDPQENGASTGLSLGVYGTAGGGGGSGGGGGGGSDGGVGAPEPGTVALGLSALALVAGHWFLQWRRKRA